MKKSGISPNMQKAAILIAQGVKLKEVAKACDVSPQTLSDWRANDFFVVLCNRIQQNILDVSVARLINLSVKAVKNFEEMLDSEDDKLKFEASKEVLKISGLNQPVSIGATTYKEHLDNSAFNSSFFSMTELQIEIDEAVQKASIVE